MKIILSNTLGKTKEEFNTIDGSKTVRMYSCGPTVYNIAHIGNLRAYVCADILKRVLLYNGYEVKHIINVTDIGHLTSDADSGEDKMVKALKREGKDMTLHNMRSVADFYFQKFKEDTKKLNILDASHYPFASDHIKEDIDLIENLQNKHIAYKTSDGIYFDTSKVSYGKLFKSTSEDDSRKRIEHNQEKRNFKDFALWKFADENGVGFEAPFGKGFPGWHIECSAMSEKYLGVPFDIHTGGIDHIPVHHNNEIAQTEGARDELLARFWIHNAHITIGEEKMAKSGENFLSLSYLEAHNLSPLAYRYWLLTSHYSTQLSFDISYIEQAQNAFKKLKNALGELPPNGSVNEEYKQSRFIPLINNDLDTPKAIALVWEILKDPNLSPEDKKATILDFDKVFGLSLSSEDKEDVPQHIKELASKRDLARKNKDWQESDELRDQIQKQGFDIKDTDEGFLLIKK